MRHFVSELQILVYDMNVREGTEVPGRPPHSLEIECQVLARSKNSYIPSWDIRATVTVPPTLPLKTI